MGICVSIIMSCIILLTKCKECSQKQQEDSVVNITHKILTFYYIKKKLVITLFPTYIY